jgi:hypothetical protein
LGLLFCGLAARIDYTPAIRAGQAGRFMVSNSQYGPLVQKDRRYRAGNGLIPANFASFLGKSERTIGFLPHIENCWFMVTFARALLSWYNHWLW